MRNALGRILLVVSFVLGTFRAASAGAENSPDHFAIRIANLSGEKQALVARSSWQQMSHPRLSPNGIWVTFTRYNNKRWGIAQESDGYENTEIMIVRLDGTEMKTVVPPKENYLNCNSSWADEGRSLVWVSTENEEGAPWLMKIELASGKVSRIPTPKNLKTTDPHIVGNAVVFPVIDEKEGVDSIWMMNLDGSNLRRVTHSKHPGGFRWFALPPGDYDPKLSPDGGRIAFMRLQKTKDWKIYVVDSTGDNEKNLSGDFEFDIVPDWSSDGKLLLFSHIDVEDFSKMGIYSINPDGSGRKIIPLPPGQLPNHPHFFPNSGSGLAAMFIYQTMRLE